jgi:hypothetical protein
LLTRAFERSRLLALALTVLACLLARPARAQPVQREAVPTPAAPVQAAPPQATGAAEISAQELARARTLFQRGVALAEQEDFAGAAQRFREAYAIHAAAAVEYNLAAALFELGRHEEAFNRAQNVQRDPEAPEALRERAQKLARALYTHTARLTVTASSSTEEDVEVQIDAQPLPPGWMGVPRAVSPGKHHIRAAREGKTISEREVQVPLRTAVIIDVSLIVAEVSVPQSVAAITTVPDVVAPVPGPDPGVEKKARDKRRRIRVWSGIAAGVVVLGTGIALAVVLSKDEPTSTGVMGDFTPGVLTW